MDTKKHQETLKTKTKKKDTKNTGKNNVFTKKNTRINQEKLGKHQENNSFHCVYTVFSPTAQHKRNQENISFYQFFPSSSKFF